MENDRSTPDITEADAADAAADAAEDSADEQYDENDPMDKYDDGVLAADATGMLASERLITVGEIVEADPDLAPGLLGETQESDRAGGV
jgi:hypothetical protein